MPSAVMPASDEPTLGEVYRTFLDFREETRDQYKFVIRLLIGTLVSAVLGNLAAASVVVIFK
jgi:hypothetical protein